MLTCTAGSVNAVGFLGMHHQAISHMSGTITVLSNELATGRYSLAVYASAVVLSFFAGCVLSSAIIRQSVLKLGRRYGVVLVVESLLLIVASRMPTPSWAWKRRMSSDCPSRMPPSVSVPSTSMKRTRVIRSPSQVRFG